nr:D'42 [African swine fever virus]
MPTPLSLQAPAKKVLATQHISKDHLYFEILWFMVAFFDAYSL